MGLTVGALVAGASPAAAGVTLGQVPTVSPSFANSPETDWLEPTVTTGFNSYVVPAGGGAITSWSTFGAKTSCTPSCGMTLLVLRPAGGTSYNVVAHDGPHTITSAALNTFSGLNIAVQAGDVVGLNNAGGDPSGDAPVFPTPDASEETLLIDGGGFMDGSTLPFTSSPGRYLLNLSVQLGEPSTPTAPAPPVPAGEETKESPKSGGSSHIGTPGGTVEASGGSAVVTVECAGEAPCSVEVTMSSSPNGHAANASSKRKVVLVGRAEATIQAGKTERVRVKLTKAGARLLRAHHGRIAAKLLITGTGGTARIDISRSVIVAAHPHRK